MLYLCSLTRIKTRTIALHLVSLENLTTLAKRIQWTWTVMGHSDIKKISCVARGNHIKACVCDVGGGGEDGRPEGWCLQFLALQSCDLWAENDEISPWTNHSWGCQPRQVGLVVANRVNTQSKQNTALRFKKKRIVCGSFSRNLLVWLRKTVSSYIR